jgi:putative transposase
MNRAFKFRIYPNSEQEIFFAKTFGCTRFVYNKMLGEKIEYYKETNKMLKNTPAQYKEEFEWLKEVDSLALANAQLHLETAYKNFFRDPKIGFPKFKSKKSNQFSYTTNNQNGTIYIKENYIKLPKLKTLVKTKQHREIPEDAIIKSATISKTATGKYYISILVEIEEEKTERKVDVNKAIGIDFSMKELIVTSMGTKPDYPRYYRQAQDKLSKEQRKLSLCEKGSNNRNKQRQKVARLHEKVKNQRQDFLHKLSRQITNECDIVCIEDLNMKAMSQCLNFGKSVADNSYGKFVEYLTYKLDEEGKKLIKIDKWFPSSKTCSNCGRIKEELLLSERIYSCGCGYIEDRDINAAINIRNEGLRIMLA